MSKWFDISKLKSIAAGLVASGKKNAPTLMTAGSIALGWLGVYFIWQESRKVEQKIEFEEAMLNADEDSDILPEERKKLPTKEKLILYAQYCWPAAVMGLTSTGLAIGANSINLSRLAEMALLTQFMTDKDEKQKKLIEKLKGEVGDKKFAEMKDELRDEEYPEEEIQKERIKLGPGTGNALIIDEDMHKTFPARVEDVRRGIDKINKRLQDDYDRAIDSHGNGAFDETDWPFDGGPYSRVDLDTFLKYIGEIPMYSRDNNGGLGDVLEFKYYGGGKYHVHSDLIKWNDIASYDERFIDPETGLPVVVFLDYRDLLTPTSELIERNTY